MPAAKIRPTRLEVNDRFPMLGFTIRGDQPGLKAEIAIGTDPMLFTADGRAGRTPGNFFSSRATGDLTIPRGQAVWVVPPEILARFVGAERIYFGLATAQNGGAFRVEQLPTPASPYVSLKGMTGRSLRRVRIMPSRQRPFPGGLDWAGDAAVPGQQPVAAPQPANGATAPAEPYDDGFGPLPQPAAPTAPDPAAAAPGAPAGAQAMRARGFAGDPDAMGIEGPAASPAASAAAAGTQGYARALDATPDYDRASRFAASPAFTVRPNRTIDRIVIHITDAPTTSSTVNHFTRADANSSAHYLVGQDGEVIQFVREADVAWHARGVNSRSIGIEHVCVKEGGATYGSTTFPHLPPSEIQYNESAALVSHLCDKYGIPADREHIIGHAEADPNTTHTTCPGGAPWDWDYFMEMVRDRVSLPMPAAQSLSLPRTPRNPQPPRPRPAARAMIIGPEDVQRAQQHAPHWRELYNFRPPQSVLDALSARGFSVQWMASAAGSLNLDEYKVVIDRMPDGWDGPSLLRHFAQNINDFLDTGNTEFIPYDGHDAGKIAAGDPVGAVWFLDIVGPDNAAVVIAESTSERFRVTTINTPRSGDHPVTGNREFGWRQEGGATVLYTMGADRSTHGFPEFVVFGGADSLWRSFQAKTVAWIQANGGTAHAPQPFSERFHPEVVRILYGTAQGLSGALAVVDMDYAPADPQAARAALADFNQRAQSWRAGVPDTGFMPHSAICQITPADGRPHGTGFYVSHDLILTAAHVVEGQSSLTIHVGRNGGSVVKRFTVSSADWTVHPSRRVGVKDFDLAVIRVAEPPPHGWFSLFEQNQSTEDMVIVCGYAASAGDPTRQHLDGDYIRRLSPNAETMQYNLQTTGGTSGSPVFIATGYEDDVAQQSVLDWAAFGVHVSGFDRTLNQACRLTQAKIDWIYGRGLVAAHGMGNGRARAFQAERAEASAPGSGGARTRAARIGGRFDLRIGEALDRGVTEAALAPLLDLLDPPLSTSARLFSVDIPLDPGAGGMSIGYDALNVGDIILSTGDSALSGLIRFGSGGQVSHAMLYVDQGRQVIEAVGQGVVLRPLDQALAEATVAVVFRAPGLTPGDERRIADEAAGMIGAGYSYTGIARQAAFQIDRRLCDKLPNGLSDRCRNFAGRIDLGTAGNDSFFCSQMVLEAFARAGHPLTTSPPHWATPQDLAELAFDYSRLRYVGHLKAAPTGGLFGQLPALAQSAGGTRRRPPPPPAPSRGAARGLDVEAPPPLQIRRTESHDRGGVRFALEQLDGMRAPRTQSQAVVTPLEARLAVADWPRLPDDAGGTYAGIDLAWRHAGGAVGDVRVSPAAAAIADGYKLEVAGRVLDGPDEETRAAVTVELDYRFNRAGEAEQLAQVRVVLRGDGSHERTNAWALEPMALSR